MIDLGLLALVTVCLLIVADFLAWKYPSPQQNRKKQ